MLILKDIYKDYNVDSKPLRVLFGINLSFDKSGFISILGPSGCGKTTLLNIIGGLDKYTSGDMIIEGKSTKLFSDRDWDVYRNNRIGFVFQSYNLIPHLSVIENVALSLTLVGMNVKERKEKAKKVLERVGLGDVVDKKPNQLSGGQMQRVAIARALVNDPDIILADEPTGALDSKTSVQVMKILKEISKDKLVIMVTHNTDIAKKYSTRIITLKDGVVETDSAPINDNENIINTYNTSAKKTSMSFFTAAKISFKNILTKKGRNSLTAIAGSFGIIGVALVLALSNGFTQYVHSVEVSTANSLPLTIQRVSSVKITDESTFVKYPDDPEIICFDPDTSYTGSYHFNSFTPEYIDYVEELETLNKASSIMVNHNGLTMNLLSKYDDNTIVKVNERGSTGSFSSTVVSAISSLPTSVWHELYGDEEYITSMYDVIGGEYPKDESEVVLIVDAYNRVYKNALINLGLASTTDDKIDFEDIIGHEFKVFYNDEIYTNKYTGTGSYQDYEGTFHTTPIDRYQVPDFSISNVRTNYWNNDTIGKKLKITGILRANESTYLELMQPSIGYMTELKDSFVARDYVSDIAKSMHKNAVLVDSEALSEAYKFLEDSSYISTKYPDCTTVYDFINVAMKFFNPGLLASPTSELTSVGISAYLDLGYQYGSDLSNEYGLMPYEDVNLILTQLSSALAYSLVTSIVIFPVDLSSKTDILKYLDKWNDDHARESGRVYYTDTIGTITDSFGVMIQVISSVLIAFAASALAVSCVMTAIITYVSVLERTKEIGILRAIGARKRDVTRLFETENFIVGAFSGIIGVLVTVIVSFPINIGLNNVYPDQGLGNIASLPLSNAIILVAVSIVLNVLAGLIPSLIAAKKDPVVALRTE